MLSLAAFFHPAIQYYMLLKISPLDLTALDVAQFDVRIPFTTQHFRHLSQFPFTIEIRTGTSASSAAFCRRTGNSFL
jgi:hypothetical protein